MGELVKISAPSSKVKGPDFSKFSIRPTSYSINLSNDIANEDTISLQFIGEPTFDGETLQRRMNVKFDIPDVGTVDMLVKSFGFNYSGGRLPYQLTLGTRKLFFDTYLNGGWAASQSQPTIREVLNEICGKLLGLTTKIEVEDRAWLWPGANASGSSNPSISSKQNLLEWIDMHFTADGRYKIFSWWMDMFNVLHVYSRMPDALGKKDLAYKDIKPFITNYSYNVSERWDEKDTFILSDSGPVKETTTKTKLTYKVKETEKDYEVKFKEKKIHSTAGSNSDGVPAEGTPEYVQYLTQYHSTVNIGLKGFYLIPPHYSVRLKDFPSTIDEPYLVTGVSINGTPGQTTTQLNLENIEVKMPDRKIERLWEESSLTTVA